MPQVARPAVKERAARLRAKGEDALAGHLRAQVGTAAAVLMERGVLGRTPSYAEIELAGPAVPGAILVARVTASDGKRLQGEPLATTCAS